MKKKLLSRALALALCVMLLPVFGACSEKEAPAADAQQPQTTAEQVPETSKTAEPRKTIHMVCGTSANTGTFYAYGGNWAQVMNDKVEGCDISIEVSGGPTKNLQLLGQGDIDIGFTTGWMAGEAYSGTGEFEGNQLTNAKAMFPMYSSVMYLVTLANSDIKTLRDLEGKHVATGSPGGTSDKAARKLLPLLGITPSQISSLTGDTLSSSFKDGTVDAMFYVGSIPASVLLSIETSNPLSFVQISDADFDEIFKGCPYWTADTMDAGVYKGQDMQVRMISFWNYAVCREDLDADLVYDMVKATFENQVDLAGSNKNFATTLAENVSKIGTELHPGAYRYYQEIGIEVPADIIPAA